MDLIEALAKNLDMNPTALAELVYETAKKVVESAAKGTDFDDTLTREQLAFVLVALQWNSNPMIRTAVKLKPG